MKRTFARRNLILVGLLTLLLAGVPSLVSQAAEGGSKWNPANWFSAQPKDEAVEAAQKRAEETRLEAERARVEAEKARQRAAKAQRVAEESMLKQRDSASDGKPRVVTPTSSATANPTERTQTTQADKGRSTGWNMLNLFKGGDEEAAESKGEPASKPKKEEVAKKEDAEEKSGRRMLGLFGKKAEPENTAAQPATAAQKNSQPAAAVNPSLKSQAALIETEKGNIAIVFYPDDAPLTVNNFVKLVQDGFYNKYNMKFHRVVPGFVIQTGDPTGTGAGGSKEHIPLEVKNKLSHNAKGMVAMARGPDPNSASSQFYITLAPQISLDGKYAIFGKVISGLDVLDKIEVGDMLYGVRLVDVATVTRDQPAEKKGLFSKMF